MTPIQNRTTSLYSNLARRALHSSPVLNAAHVPGWTAPPKPTGVIKPPSALVGADGSPLVAAKKDLVDTDALYEELRA